jgi:hypothetical protein
MAHDKGAQVRQIVPAPIVGTVKERRLHDEAGEIEYLVEWTDGDGNPASRWFLASQIEVA